MAKANSGGSSPGNNATSGTPATVIFPDYDKRLAVWRPRQSCSLGWRNPSENRQSDTSRLREPTTGSRIRANQAAGNAARDAIAAAHPGSLIEQSFVTAFGVRRLDVLAKSGLAIESKVGRTSLTSTIQAQIAKDQWLLQNSVDVTAVEWVFSCSGVTGQIGPTGPLAAAQQGGYFVENGAVSIHWNVYEPYDPGCCGPGAGSPSSRGAAGVQSVSRDQAEPDRDASSPA